MNGLMIQWLVAALSNDQEIQMAELAELIQKQHKQNQRRLWGAVLLSIGLTAVLAAGAAYLYFNGEVHFSSEELSTGGAVLMTGIMAIMSLFGRSSDGQGQMGMMGQLATAAVAARTYGPPRGTSAAPPSPETLADG